jgi:hypothetical protein
MNPEHSPREVVIIKLRLKVGKEESFVRACPAANEAMRQIEGLDAYDLYRMDQDQWTEVLIWRNAAMAKAGQLSAGQNPSLTALWQFIESSDVQRGVVHERNDYT